MKIQILFILLVAVILMVCSSSRSGDVDHPTTAPYEKALPDSTVLRITITEPRPATELGKFIDKGEEHKFYIVRVELIPYGQSPILVGSDLCLMESTYPVSPPFFSVLDTLIEKNQIFLAYCYQGDIRILRLGILYKGGKETTTLRNWTRISLVSPFTAEQVEVKMYRDGD